MKNIQTMSNMDSQQNSSKDSQKNERKIDWSKVNLIITEEKQQEYERRKKEHPEWGVYVTDMD